jgi:pimeloyl-ACP methyl ester carboxylesterase
VTAALLASVTLVALAALWAFTFVQTRRIEARYPPVGAKIDVGGGAIHVVDTATLASERGVVTLIHGASGNFADLHVALSDRLSAEGFRVLSVDRPGHGWSDRVPGRDASSPACQAALLRRAAERLGVDAAIVVGHSLGGMTALAMALDWPEFVRALVLISPLSHPWPGGVDRRYKVGAHPVLGPPFRRLLALPIGLARMDSGVKGAFAPSPPPPRFIDPTRLPLVLRPRQFLFNCEDVVDAKAAVAALSPRYGEIRAPTEIVTSDTDGVVSPEIHSAGCARDIPDARLTTLPGVGHLPHHIAPAQIVAIILEADRRACETQVVLPERSAIEDSGVSRAN